VATEFLLTGIKVEEKGRAREQSKEEDK